MADVLIKAENVSKKFCSDLKKSLWYGVKDIASELSGRASATEVLRPGEFWSVKEVSFEVKRGECLGLVGPNGAGKSTLLKMLNGLIKPDRGRITIRGRVGALIELGAGFNPILTGRENICVNGAVLGFTKAEIDQKFDSIVDFAEIGAFLDTPVQNYSSGMKVRLGFAIAAHMDPDILLIDEVLAVGDVGFRAKCFNAINTLSKRTAVVFVTHAMPQVSRVCSNILVMSDGRSVFQGNDIPSGIDRYYVNFDREAERIAGSGKAIIHSIELATDVPGEPANIEHLGDLILHIDCTIAKSVQNPNVSIIFVSDELQNVAQCSSFLNGFIFDNNGERSIISVHLERVMFNPGRYSVSITITAENRGEVLAKHENIKTFRVQGKHIGFAPMQLAGNWTVSTT